MPYGPSNPGRTARRVCGDRVSQAAFWTRTRKDEKENLQTTERTNDMRFRRALGSGIPLVRLTSPKDELGARARNGRDRGRMRRTEIRDKV